MLRSASLDSCSRHKRAHGSPTNKGNNFSGISGGCAASEDYEKQHKKGFLAFAQTMGTIMALFNLGLFTTSNQMSSNNPWMKALCSGSIIPLASSTILASLASYYKESQLVHKAGFQIFKTLLLFQFTHFYTVLFIIMKFHANVSLNVVLTAGISGACLIVLLWVVSVDQTQYLEKWTKVTFEFLKKWTKILWEKMACCLYRRSQTQILTEP